MSKMGHKRKLTGDSKKKLNKDCEELWRKAVKAKGFCERCGRTDKVLNAHHIYPKGRFMWHPLKWDVQNGLCLCFACHIHWAHQHPIEFTHWFENKYPERAVYLHERSLKIEKIDFNAVLAQLKGE